MYMDMRVPIQLGIVYMDMRVLIQLGIAVCTWI